MDYHVKDINLAPKGKNRIEWAEKDMPVLRSIRERFVQEKPFANVNVAACLHVTTETANLMITLKEGGANIMLCASNPLSTQDDVAASLVKDFGIPTYAISGEDIETYHKHLNIILDAKPELTMDDGADLVFEIHERRKELIGHVKGSTEETTTGVIRTKAMAKDGNLKFPVLAVNDAMTKHLFDNRYGTGQSTIDGILRATNRMLAGSTFVVGGYGWCGRGLAMRARGMGAKTIVCEVDPIKALEAVMDGFEVMPMVEAAKRADFICTVTGDIGVVDENVFSTMKDGCILSNAGHFDVEVDVKKLAGLCTNKRKIRDTLEEYTMADGRKLYVIAEGRLVNLVSAEGHPSSVMDMSFANQALGAEYIWKNYKELKPQVYVIPTDIDNMIAKIKLKSLGINIDILTPEQEKYLNSWNFGT